MRHAVVIALLLAGGCRQILGIERAVTDDAAASDASGDAASDVAPDAPGPWTDIELVAESATGDIDPSLTADLLELYFRRDDDIYLTTRATAASVWAPADVVVALSTGAKESDPAVSPDGLVMVFTRELFPETGEVMISYRQDRTMAWGTPVRLASLGTNSDEGAGGMTADGLRIVIASNRDNASYDLYEATRTSEVLPFGAPVPITAVNTTQEENNAHLTADGLALYFDALNGTRDLFVATRAALDEPFGPRVKIGELSSDTVDATPWVSPDGHDVFFSSNRGGDGLRLYHAHR